MKIIKPLILTILALATIGLFLREWIYNETVNYKSIGLRANYSASNPKLTDYIESTAGDLDNPDINKIVQLSLSTTSRQLNFTSDNNYNDPNKLIDSRTAHCVGYATFFAATCNYLLEKYQLSKVWTAKPQIGQLYFLGANVHKYLNSPFLKDHDFVTIENIKTGEVLAVDPTVYDYLGIDLINYMK